MKTLTDQVLVVFCEPPFNKHSAQIVVRCRLLTPRGCALLRVIIFLLAVSAFGVLQLHSQEPCCTVSGKVTDQFGVAISRANISVESRQSGKSQRVSSGDDGSFSVNGLTAGRYIVKATAAGFAPKAIEIVAQPEKSALVSLVLEPASKSGTTSSQVGEAVGSKKVREIPLNGRSATDVATLEPGVATARTQTSGSAAQRGFGTQITISGGRPRQNDSRLDGISVNDYANSPAGSAAGVNLGVDAVEQVSVLSSNYPAQYGRSSGGIVSSTTRSGTKHFHGSVFEFFRNSALDARNYFDLKKPPFKRNQFGGTFGGPVWKDRTFFFVAYEGFRQSLGISQVTVVPSESARSGAGLDPKTLRFINAFYPLPQSSSGDTGIFNFAGQQVIPDNYFNSRIDHNLSRRDVLTGTYMQDVATVRQPDELNNKRTGYDSHRRAFTLAEVHTKDKMVNSLRLGINRVVATTGLTFLAGNPLAADSSFGGVPGQNAPQVNIAGLTSFTGGIDVPSNYRFHWTSIQGYEDFSLIRGKHTLKLGGGLERMRDNILADSDPGGVFSFNSLADFLANKPFSFSAAIPGTQSERGLREIVAAAYFQDHWAWMPNVSFDFGLRYEISSIPSEVHNRLTVLRNLTDAAPHLGAPLFSNPTFRNFEPRIGVAWNPSGTGKSTISAGFGMFDVLPLPYLVQFNEVNSAPFAQHGSSTSLPVGSFPDTAFLSISANPDAFRQAYFDPNPPRSYVMQWNLNLERALAKGVSITAAYVGSRGIHQPFRVEDADIVLPTATPQGYVWPSSDTHPQRLNIHAGRITAGFWRSDAYYHGLETKLQGEIGRANIEASYTWGKTIDTSSASLVGDEYTNSISSPLFFAPRLNRGLADFNVAHNLEVNYNFEFPTPMWTTLAAKALGGWRLGGVFEASTGVPFTPVIGGDALGLQSTDPTIDVPDVLHIPGCGSLVNSGNPKNYIKEQCFAFPDPPTRLGNLGRNTLIGPGLLNFDLSLIKNTYIKKVSDSFNIQFRAEFFNVFNHSNFAPPLDNKTLFEPSGERISTAGLITSTQTPSRQIQFAVKLIW